MSATQPTLLNTRGMSSAKEMRKLRRGREVERLRLCRKTKMEVSYRQKDGWEQAGFPMADEDRYFIARLCPCPECGYNQDQHLDRRVVGRKTEFRVGCGAVQGSFGGNCNFSTPWLKSSQLAIQHWKVVAALSK